MALHSIGDRIALGIIRTGKQQTVNVKIADPYERYVKGKTIAKIFRGALYREVRDASRMASSTPSVSPRSSPRSRPGGSAYAAVMCWCRSTVSASRNWMICANKRKARKAYSHCACAAVTRC